MFRHKGNARTFRHNIKLAAFLSFTAGIVNICGVIVLGVLTTNVTGHFAFFAEGLLIKNDQHAFQFLFYILFFLFGSFLSGLVTEYCISMKSRSPHKTVLLLEIVVLFFIGLFGDRLIELGVNKPILACLLLFSMGLQNSLVTRVSGSAVRTTHLTGLFTDLGIELSQLIFYNTPVQRKTLLHSIGLRGSIIVFFFLGCMAGGLGYRYFQCSILLLAVLILILALFYDSIKMKFYKIRRAHLPGNDNKYQQN